MPYSLDPRMRSAAARVADWHRARSFRNCLNQWAQIVPPEPPIAPPPPPAPDLVPPIVDPINPGENKPIKDPPSQPMPASDAASKDRPPGRFDRRG
ncbi:MAG TPA: hypothetical protein VFP68_16300 [Burkholderiaceae bacterium]|nr:hypothetical protein [Burkholderiaceae bacterium]